jgi:hypothetical protein
LTLQERWQLNFAEGFINELQKKTLWLFEDIFFALQGWLGGGWWTLGFWRVFLMCVGKDNIAVGSMELLYYVGLRKDSE